MSSEKRGKSFVLQIKSSRLVRVAAGMITDIMLTWLILCIFAVFHHVIPYTINKRPHETDISLSAAIPAATERPESASSEKMFMSENDTAALPISWREKFRSHFSDTVIMDEMSYSSPQMSVSVERVQLDEKRRCQTYYIADIYIAQIENLCTAAANDSFTRYEPMGAEILAQQNDAILQINGDYCSAHTNKDFFVRNGIPYYDGVTSNDICVLYYDGSIETYSPGEYEIEEILDLHPYQVWIFGPRLLDSDGKPLENFNTTGSHSDR